MKKFVLSLALLAGLFVAMPKADAQTYPPIPLVYGVSPFQDSLWGFDTTGNAYTVKVKLGPTLPGYTITGMNGLAFDPCGFKTYIIMKVSGVTGRVLGTIDLSTGVCTQVGNLGDNFASITFDRTGQLYGVTGDGATVPETFYAIDKTNASKTLLTALGNGADGEVICYNYSDNMMYHWSGNGTAIFEKFAAVAPYTITPISPSLGKSETFGTLYLGANRFLYSNIASSFFYADTLGNFSSLLAYAPDDIRGLAFPAAFAASDDTICAKQSLSIGATGVYLHTCYYNWGDGSADTVVNAGATHTYNTAGNYTVTVLLDGGYCTPDTAFIANVRVNNIPVVTLSGSTALCPGGSVTLTGSTGGTAQWFMDGMALPGASGSVYTATAAGTYNMIKTNINGCSDSSATSLVVVDVLNPVVYLGPDTTVCGGLLLDALNAGSSFLWNDSTALQTLNADSTSIYWVVVTDGNGCSASDSVNLIVNPLPVVTYTELQDTVCIDGGVITLTAGTPANGIYSGTAVTTNTFDPNAAGTGTFTITYSYTDLLGCNSSASSDIVVQPLPAVAYTEVQDTLCLDAGASTLTAGTPAGGVYSGTAVSGNSFNATTAGAGTYTITYTYTDPAGCTNTASSDITVLSLPVVSYVELEDTVCVTETAVALTPGNPAGGTYSGTGVTGSTFNASTAGLGTIDITYSYTDAYGCSNSVISTITVEPCSGIAEHTGATVYQIYPNPSAGVFRIQDGSNATGDVVIRVYNSVGMLVYESMMNSGIADVDLGELPDGIYSISLRTEQGVDIIKVIKQQ